MHETAAFFRVEGALVTRPPAAAAAFLAANAAHLRERLARLSGVVAATPLALARRSGADPVLATRVLWSAVRGLSEDRIAVLAEDYAERFLLPSLRPTARDLIATARSQGHRIVLLSEHIEPVAARVARELGASDLLANRLEVRDGRATGRLLDPVLTAHATVQCVRAFAQRERIDLTRSAAYATRTDDSLLLGSAGRPCVVSPDRGLRRMARDLDWPVVEA